MRLTHTFIFGCIGLSMLSACSYSPNMIKEVSSTSLINDFVEVQCCVNLENMHIHAMDTNITFFTLRENEQKLQIGGIAYPYSTFKVPNENGEQYLKLTSFFFDQKSEKKVSLPMVLILNEDRSVSRKSNVNMLDYRNQNIYDSENFFLYIKIDKSVNPREEYIVIISDSGAAGQTFDYQEAMHRSTVPVIAGNNLIGMMPVDEGGRRFDFIAVPFGNYKLEKVTNPLSKPFKSFVHF